MCIILETKSTTIRATFAHIEDGEPPSIAFHKTLTRPDGKQKYIAMTVPIRDEHLLARAERELRSGDVIEITVETRWAEVGIPKTLLDFAEAPAPHDKKLLAVGCRLCSR